MLDLISKKVFENNTKIESMFNQLNKRKTSQFIFLAVTLYTMSKMVKKHEEKISNLENELKEMKSKGE